MWRYFILFDSSHEIKLSIHSDNFCLTNTCNFRAETTQQICRRVHSTKYENVNWRRKYCESCSLRGLFYMRAVEKNVQFNPRRFRGGDQRKIESDFSYFVRHSAGGAVKYDRGGEIEDKCDGKSKKNQTKLLIRLKNYPRLNFTRMRLICFAFSSPELKWKRVAR